jgi:hypothetical protein
VLLLAPLAVEILRTDGGGAGSDARLVRVALSGLIHAVRSYEVGSDADFTAFCTDAITAAIDRSRAAVATNPRTADVALTQTARRPSATPR